MVGISGNKSDPTANAFAYLLWSDPTARTKAAAATYSGKSSFLPQYKHCDRMVVVVAGVLEGNPFSFLFKVLPVKFSPTLSLSVWL